MLRTLLIALTSISLMFSSLGMTEVLHRCLMEESTTDSSTCAMCAEMDPSDCDESGASISAPRPSPCCTTVETTHRLDAKSVDWTATVLPAPLLTTSDSFGFLLQDCLEPVSVTTNAVDLPPPMLAELGRHTYLRTSVFLI
jgi:hypothetical protein